MAIAYPIKDTETINAIKDSYKTKNQTMHLLLFVLSINTGASLSNLLKLNIKDIKDKDYIKFGNKIFLLNKEIKRLVSKVTQGRSLHEPLFLSARENRLERTNVFRMFKEICSELELSQNINVTSWRKTFGYHHYKKYKDLAYLMWLFNQTSIKSALNFIDIKENMNLRFKKGMGL